MCVRYADHIGDGAILGGERKLKAGRRVGDKGRIDGGRRLHKKRAELLAVRGVAVLVAREAEDAVQVEGSEAGQREHFLRHREGELVNGLAVVSVRVGALDDAGAEDALLLQLQGREGECRDRGGGRDLRRHDNCDN